MNEIPGFVTDHRWILSCRGPKNNVDHNRPYAFLVEQEHSAKGNAEDVAVIFLTNSECPFSCLMCDLWKNTTDKPVSPGSITRQIEYALSKLPETKHIKLYNSGSFFDKRAIARDEYESIANLVRDFETVIVESHPFFIGESCLEFKRLLKGDLEVALGLETIHPGVISRLNKRLTPESYRDAVSFLNENDIRSRAFILLRPPFLTESEGIFWAQRTIDYAFDSGAECCTVIPVRPGNGAMDELLKMGYFALPSVGSLEQVLEYGIILKRGRVFADTWDLELFSKCPHCFEKRKERITEMNLRQEIIPVENCSCHQSVPSV